MDIADRGGPVIPERTGDPCAPRRSTGNLQPVCRSEFKEDYVELSGWKWWMPGGHGPDMSTERWKLHIGFPEAMMNVGREDVITIPNEREAGSTILTASASAKVNEDGHRGS